MTGELRLPVNTGIEPGLDRIPIRIVHVHACSMASGNSIALPLLNIDLEHIYIAIEFEFTIDRSFDLDGSGGTDRISMVIHRCCQ